jgi:endonuclease/exonuclease/phosphatase family metal-dependent hydrolase
LLDDCARCDGLRGADVLLVQEAVVGAVQRGAAAIDSITALVGALGFPPAVDAARHVRFFGAPHGHAAHWGVAILSRYPAVFHDVPLPRPRWSPWPRGAILAEIGPFVVGTLHLEVWPIGAPARRRQIATVLETIAGLPGSGGRPIVLAGDFNCARGAPHDLLRNAGFTAVPMAAPTWSFAGVRLQLDHAYVRGARVAAAGIEHTARGSDHRPLWAEVEAAAVRLDSPSGNRL